MVIMEALPRQPVTIFWATRFMKPARACDMKGSEISSVRKIATILGNENQRHFLHLRQRLQQRDRKARHPVATAIIGAET